MFGSPLLTYMNLWTDLTQILIGELDRTTGNVLSWGLQVLN